MSFPYDLTELVRAKLAAERRPPDGMLHPSGALTGSIRHLQLEVAGAPMKEPDLVSEVNLLVGTRLHTWFEELYRGRPVMTEVKLDAWLPEGWSGTADWLVWNSEERYFTLGDLKSCKPGAIHYLTSGGSKESQIWQASCYWHACVGMGLTMDPRFNIYHLPKSQNTAREGEMVAPVLNECVPVPLEKLVPVMNERKAAVDAYIGSLPIGDSKSVMENWLTDALAPVQSRDLALRLNKTLKVPALDLKLEPNWSTAYCDFPPELCNCSQQTASKMGHWSLEEDGELSFTFSRGVENSPQNRALVDSKPPKPWHIADLVAAKNAKSSPSAG